VFESVQSDDAAAQFRSAAIAPFAAFLAYLLYLALYPLLGRVPAALFWIMTAILFAGSVFGAIAIIRVFRRHRGTAFGWFAAAVLVELLCVRTFFAMTVPWLL
jgi:hypothetical protein